MDLTRLLIILVQAGTFVAAFAGIAAATLMLSVTRKFGIGILASSFKTISWGVFLIAAALVLDALVFYLQVQDNALPTLVKAILLIAGTYTIVIGAKNTADKLESLTK